MPVFNADRYLVEATDSVLAQTYAELELIAVDDGSTDRSPQILAEYASRDPRVRVITIENGGIARALNAGIEASQGEFIARMDADDICLPRRFERQLAFMKAHPECVALGTGTCSIDEDGDILRSKPKRCTSHSEIDAAHFAGKCGVIAHPTAMIRRAALVEIGGYRDLQPAEDLDLWFRLAEVGKLANLPEVLLRYRLRADSVSSAQRQVRLETITTAFTDANKRRGTNYSTSVIKFRKPYTPLRHAIRCMWLAVRGRNYRTACKHSFRAVGLSCHSLWRSVPRFRGFRSQPHFSESKVR